MPENKQYELLSEGTYGSKKEAGLRVLQYFGARETKTEGTTQHSFLVGSTNGTNGTAFLRFNLRESWLTPGAVALAMNDHGNVGKVELDAAAKELYAEALSSVKAANTPADQMEKATDDQYQKNLVAAQISLGKIFRLQDWDDGEHNPKEALDALVDCQFAGHVSHREFNGKTTAEVDRIFPRRSARE